MRFFNRIPLVVLLLTPAISLSAQSVVDPSGHWEGAIQGPDMEVKVEIDLAKSVNGELMGTFAQPNENLKGLPLSNFAATGATIRFQLRGTAGERAFEGTLSPDGKTMSGGFTVQGVSMPFRLTRTGDAKIEAAASIAAIGKDLEGTWNGTLEAGGTLVRIVLTMANLSDGTATASLTTLDQGLEIPVSSITQAASTVTLEIKTVGSSYVGTLNEDATELAGTFTQRGRSAPLTFQRAGK